MKKSKSSVPLFADKAPPDPVPPVKNDGLLATAGRPDPEPPDPPTPPFVAIAVGNTKEGESLPAKPSRHQKRPDIAFESMGAVSHAPNFEKPVPLFKISG